ncbi:hypothetical protein ACA910_012822 [Epithemia clementina (nom. ined.)]
MLVLALSPYIACLAFQPSRTHSHSAKRNTRCGSEQWAATNFPDESDGDVSGRRQLLTLLLSTTMVVPVLGSGLPSWATTTTPTGPNDGQLPDLPPEAVRSYLQYRTPLQTSADFYVFELQDLLRDTNEWGLVGELFQVNNNRGQGIPSRIEREFTNTMRIVGLSMPPDTADEMRDAQFAFEKGE